MSVNLLILPMLFAMQEAKDTRPNILFILADDLGWSDLGCQGSSFYQSPNIDRLASQGMRFTSAYASPSCSPTRASIMTGKSPARHHITKPLASWDPPPKTPAERGIDVPWNKYITPLPPQGLSLDEVTVAERLRNAGYETALFGKWHLGGEGFEPEYQGFDIHIGGGHYAYPPSFFSPYKMGDVLSDGPDGEYLTDRLTDEAIQFITTPRSEPFFVYLSHYAVHTPLMAKPETIAAYEEAADPSDPQDNPVYAAMIDSLDENVGRIMDALQAVGLDKNTIVVFASDNGGVTRSAGGNEKVTSNLPLQSGKGTLWEGGVRVPLIIRWPGVTSPGSVCSVPVVAEDYLPTFCEIAEVPVVTGETTKLDGESITPLLKNPNATLQRDAFCWLFPHYNEFTDASASILTGNLKLIKFYGGPTQLFNLDDDIGESNDLAAEDPETAASLDAQLDAWLARVGAWEQVPNPQYDPLVHALGLYPEFDPVQDGAVLVKKWTFDDHTTDNWSVLKKCTLSVSNGVLTVHSQGYAASIESSLALTNAATYVMQMKMRERDIKKGACSFFWENDGQIYEKTRRIQFAFPHDENEHIVSVLFRVKTQVDSIRFDPAVTAGEVDFDWIRIYKTSLP